ncbi:MAG: TVP38/TMEM64 family protein [Phycisphaerae bacterium]|nr:TVP38/TMEM64 family protein [Phycisphaerae bacterium]
MLSRLGGTSVLAVGALALPPLGSIVLFAYMNVVGQWLRGHETEGVLLYIAGFALFSGCALLPTYASAILGGWAFGFAEGFPAAQCGFLGGAMIGYGVARGVSGDRVVRLIEERPAWRAVRDALVGSGFWRTLGIVILIRLPLNSPFAVCNLVLASVQVRPLVYAAGTLIGMAPRTAAVVWLATQVRDVMAEEAGKVSAPWWFLAAGSGAMIVVLLLLGVIAQRAVRRLTAGAPPTDA